MRLATIMVTALALLVLAQLSAVQADTPFNTMMHLRNLSTSGWEGGVALKRSAPPALRSNCGFLATFMATACSTSGGTQRACCEAVCSWNNAGCACLTNASAILRAVASTSVPLPGELQPSYLTSSICGFKTSNLYYPSLAGSCAKVPTSGNSKCPAAKPARESCDKTRASALAKARKATVAAVIQTAYLPVTTTTTSTAAKRLGSLLTATGAMADSNGGRAAGVNQIVNRIVKPRIPQPEANINSNASVVLTSASWASRQLVFTFKVQGRDAMGKTGTTPRSYRGVATFAPCGSRVESLWVSNPADFSIAKALARKSPFGPYASQAFTNAAVGPKTGSGRRLAATNTSYTPPAPVSLQQVETWLTNSLNKLLQSSTVQNYQFNIKGCSKTSTLNNMQFCNMEVAHGSIPMTSLPSGYSSAVSGTCNALCADGAWQDMANWVCSDACDASVQAACDSCNSGCQAGCSTCQAGITTACDSCNVACCFGCQICYPGTPAVPEECCCKVCWCIGGCCTSMCTPAIPGTPGYCLSTQLCPNGACDSTCDMSQCNGACDCSSACAGACDTSVCPDCNLQCQQSCEGDLNIATVNYEAYLNTVTGLGGLSILSVELVSWTTQTSTSYPTATYEVTMAASSVTVTGSVSAALSPSYGIPPVNQGFTNTSLNNVITKQIVVVDHICSAAGTLKYANGSATNYTARVSVSAANTGSTQGLDTDLTASQAQALQSGGWSNLDVSTMAISSATNASEATSALASQAMSKVLTRAMASWAWPWLACAFPPAAPPPPPHPPLPPLPPRSPRSPRPPPPA